MHEDERHWRHYPVHDVRILIHDDGTTEMSGILLIDRLEEYTAATNTPYEPVQAGLDDIKIVPKTIPFYIKGMATVRNNTVSAQFSKVEFGRFDVPNNLLTEYSDAINEYFTTYINGYDGFDAESVTFKNGSMQFKGTIPETIELYTK